jgi:hypothetical protein
LGQMIHLEKPWLKEADWLVLIEFLRRDDEHDRARGAEAMGYMLAYAQRTDTRMLALLGDPEADAYELLFSFNSAKNKAEFLRLLQANDITACEEEEIMVLIRMRSGMPSRLRVSFHEMFLNACLP